MKPKYLVFGDGLFGTACKLYTNMVVLSRQECDITSIDNINAAIKTYQPDVVINGAGIVPKNPSPVETIFRVNSFAPHYIADVCDNHKIPLVHLSTDCVFNGKRGKYTEEQPTDATDIYGMSKIFGETHLTGLVIRTSFVGLPDPKQRGLLAWAQHQPEIIGYDQVFWNGITTLELIAAIRRLTDEHVTGIRHIYSYTMSKYDLLMTAKEVFGWTMPIYPESDCGEVAHCSDKTLSSIYTDGFIAKPFRQQLKELRI